MKLFLCLALFAVAAQGAFVKWMEIQPAKKVNVVSHQWTPKHYWQLFKQEFKKAYSSLEEEAHRFGVFLENVKMIEEHNKHWAAGRKSYKLKINELADRTRKEINQVFNGFRRSYNFSMPKNTQKFVASTAAGDKLASSIDWRQRGAVTPVKNQGQCGSCWAFSTTGSLEGQHFLKTGKLVSLSEQQLVDCSRKFGNNGCNGGLMDQAFKYVKINKGLDTEQSYPYEAENDKCRFKPSAVGATDKGYVDVPSGDEDALKTAVGTIGPVSIAIDASRSSFHFYDGGVYDEPECSSTELDHGVLAVGYGTDEESGQDYWLVKNSWGPSWGLGGYVKMARNRDNQCGVATQASYPLV